MPDPPIPDKLLKTVTADLEPVKPVAPVWRRTLIALAISVAVFAVSVLLLGLRSDLQSLPSWLGFGTSVTEFVFAAILIALALRESIPGRGVPARYAVGAFATAIVYQLAVGYLTWRFSTGLPWDDHPIAHGMTCMFSHSMLAIPTLVVTLILIYRAYPVRAWIAGMLGGAGTAIGTDAITHLRCPVSDMRHVLLWHTGAVFLLAAIGAVAGLLWGRRARPRS